MEAPRYQSIDPFFFFFNDTATTEIYTLSLHDALPISIAGDDVPVERVPAGVEPRPGIPAVKRRPTIVEHPVPAPRSEEHTSELQSQSNLVCRLLLEKKNITGPAENWVATRHRCYRSAL